MADNKELKGKKIAPDTVQIHSKDSRELADTIRVFKRVISRAVNCVATRTFKSYEACEFLLKRNNFSVRKE